jgi:hypothetical protein
MVLSCSDLLVVLTTLPITAVIALFWLTRKENGYPSWIDNSSHLATSPIVFSLFALLVMSFDRYLATYQPFLHRTSVTKKTLLTLFGTLSFGEIILKSMFINNVISNHLQGIIILTIVGPSMVFINYKLFLIAKKRRSNGISPEMKNRFSLKNASSCLLAVACFVVLFIPGTVYIGFEMAWKETPRFSERIKLALLWGKTFASMNSTFNSVIFYWRNKILRTEGMKLIKGMKIRRSQS